MPIISPKPKSFTLCSHTSPPTPAPKALLNKVTASYPGRCQPCDISYSRSSETMVLGLYNSKVRDQRARLLIAKERKGTDQEGRYDAEMVEEGERRITEWQLKRDDETLKVWEGLVQRWGGVKVQRDRQAREEQESRMRVWVGAVEQN